MAITDRWQAHCQRQAAVSRARAELRLERLIGPLPACRCHHVPALIDCCPRHDF